jgi:hypothetical protein
VFFLFISRRKPSTVVHKCNPSYLGGQYWGLNSRPHAFSTTWATLPALFCVGYFQDIVSQAICPAWLLTMILLISTSW